MLRSITFAIIVALFAALAAACGDGDGEPTTTPAGTAAATATPGAATSPTAPLPDDGTPGEGTPVPFEGDRDPVEGHTPGPFTFFLVDVRTGRHDEGFDRVVFEFEDALPGYRVAYVQPPILGDPSGLEVDVEGTAFLQITIRSATAVDLSGVTPRQTCCRSEVTTGFPTLVDVERTGDFEAVLTYVLGLRSEVDFRVIEESDPPRLAIDVAHPPATAP